MNMNRTSFLLPILFFLLLYGGCDSKSQTHSSNEKPAEPIKPIKEKVTVRNLPIDDITISGPEVAIFTQLIQWEKYKKIAEPSAAKVLFDSNVDTYWRTGADIYFSIENIQAYSYFEARDKNIPMMVSLINGCNQAGLTPIKKVEMTIFEFEEGDHMGLPYIQGKPIVNRRVSIPFRGKKGKEETTFYTALTYSPKSEYSGYRFIGKVSVEEAQKGNTCLSEIKVTILDF